MIAAISIGLALLVIAAFAFVTVFNDPVSDMRGVFMAGLVCGGIGLLVMLIAAVDALIWWLS